MIMKKGEWLLIGIGKLLLAGGSGVYGLLELLITNNVLTACIGGSAVLLSTSFVVKKYLDYKHQRELELIDKQKELAKIKIEEYKEADRLLLGK